jgi:hypothetical protein
MVDYPAGDWRKHCPDELSGCRLDNPLFGEKLSPMGVSIHYWAVPPTSTLFRRLQSEKAFAALMAALFPYGCGIFCFFEEIDLEEREEILEWVIESRKTALGSESEARRWIAEFRQELERSRAAWPGVERRVTSLEKTSELIEERLLRELNRSHNGSAEEFLRGLMFGDQELGRNLGLAARDVLGLISARLVGEGAAALNGLDAEVLFVKNEGWEQYHLESYQHWRQLFQEAAAQGEVLLVGVC